MEKIKKNVKCILVHAFVIVKIYRKCPFYLPKYCFTETSTLRPTQSSHLLFIRIIICDANLFSIKVCNNRVWSSVEVNPSRSRPWWPWTWSGTTWEPGRTWTPTYSKSNPVQTEETVETCLIISAVSRTFFSSVPAGFPLSPGTALAELSSFSPLSPSLPSSNYHFSLSPARNQDPPSPRHAAHQRYSYKTLHSPKRHHTPQRSSLAGFPSPKRGASSSHHSPQRLHLQTADLHHPDFDLWLALLPGVEISDLLLSGGNKLLLLQEITSMTTGQFSNE